MYYHCFLLFEISSEILCNNTTLLKGYYDSILQKNNLRNIILAAK